MRCFLLLTALFGGSPAEDPRPVYINRDAILVVAPMRPRTGSEYAGSHSILTLNNSVFRYVAQTPEEVLRAPCKVGGASD